MNRLKFFLSSFACLSFSSVRCDESSLVLVHCLFRHGNRTVEPPTYPTDPHIDETYYPFGYGQLTNKGKWREYEIGKYLRNRFGRFLGELWTPEVLDALSCDFDRTKMSLQLVLAGLYHPAFTQLSWNNRINWQPIPYNYINETSDHILGNPSLNCPKYIKLYNEFLKSPEGKAIESRYAHVFKHLTQSTGEEVTTNDQVLKIYRTLEAQQDWGFELPSWTKPIWPDILNDAAGEHHEIATATDKLRQLSGGFLLKKIIQDTAAKIKGTLTPKNRKLFLYSAHDSNIGHLLGTLKVFYPHNPSYGSFILFELHKINDEYGFKLFYQNYKEKEPILLKIPNCAEFCPFTKFVRLTSGVIPLEDNPCEIQAEIIV